MDQEKIEFHIENDDYFGTLSTVINLVGQNLKVEDCSHEIEVLRAKVDELTFLQENYAIVKKAV